MIHHFSRIPTLLRPFTIMTVPNCQGFVFALLGLGLMLENVLSLPQASDYDNEYEDWQNFDSNRAQDWQTCGHRPWRQRRVTKGEPAQAGEFPWMVSIQKHKEHICGGALIADQWVLTAAHCVDEVSWLGKKGFSVLVGSNNLREVSYNAKSVAISKIISHPDFHMTYVNDIALIKLAEPVQMDFNKQAICLPRDDIKLFEHAKVLLAGWGKTSDVVTSEAYSAVLNKADLKLVTNKKCRKWFLERDEDHVIPKTLLCAGYKDGGRDSCSGDSGGPLVMKIGSRFTVVGIVSTGVGCGRPGLPGLYTNVKRFTSWINANMN